MEDDDDAGYSSSGSSTRDPNETVPDSQPPRGGLILENSPVRVSGSSGSSRYPLRSTPDRDQVRLEQERQQRIQIRQQLVSNASRSEQHRQAQQQQANSTVRQQQQAQAHQNTTSRAQPTVSASSHEVASSRGRSNAAAATTTTTKYTRGSVKNYSSEEIFALFESIRRVLPTGNEQWELVADLHSVHFANCNRSGDSIKKNLQASKCTAKNRESFYFPGDPNGKRN